jgi:hypothetical protein
MTKARTRRRSWWTAGSPYLDGDEFAVVDLTTSFDLERDPCLVGVDPVALLGIEHAHPRDYEHAIAEVLVRGPRTFAGLAAEVARVRGSDACSTAFEFALWAMVEAGSVKVSPEPPAKFAAWYSVVRPNFARAYDRTLERRYV